MKKTLRNLALLILTASTVLMLTACGDEAEDKKEDREQSKKSEVSVNKDMLVATIIRYDDVELKETTEVTFKNDKAVGAKITYEFEDEETAEEYYGILEEFLPDECKVELKGKKVTISMTTDVLTEMGEEIEGKSRSELKTYFEEHGYDVT